MKKYLFLTGAGISAESGIKTFRESGGLWDNYPIDVVASPDGFNRDPEFVWTFYKERYYHLLTTKPNPAHYALAKLESNLGKNFHLITQNVDGLHKRAGSKNIYEMHGQLTRCFCIGCHAQYNLSEIDLILPIPRCKVCDSILRPDVVWFGEIPYFLYEIEQQLKDCDYFYIIGTSGTVYPAAGFVMTAKLFGAHTVSVNLERPDNLDFIDEFHKGNCSDLLPLIVKDIIKKH